MKKFFKLINWRKFWKYELYAFLILAALYANSIHAGRNIFPENLYVVFLIPAIFAVMMLLKTHTVMMEKKFTKKVEEND